MKKVIIASVLVCVLMTTTIFAAMDFSDVNSSDWYYDNVDVLVEAGIISGYGNGVFGPEDKMNIDAFIKTMVVALGEDPGNADGYWAQNYIDKAKEMGILKTSDFNTTTKMITRADMSKLAVRTAEKLEGKKTYKYNPTTNDPLYKSITDTADIKDLEDKQFIVHAYELGLITGYPDGTFKPDAGLKRSEACTVVRRVIDETQRKPYIEPVATEWDVRAKKIYKETGYVVWTDTTPSNSGVVITTEQLKNDDGKWVFGSHLEYSDKISDDGVWAVSVGFAGMEKYEDNEVQQMYELEYILTEIWNVEEDIIEQIYMQIEERLSGNGTPYTKYEQEDGTLVRVTGASPTSKTMEISGFYFQE